MFADLAVSNSTLLTVALCLLIRVAVVWLLNHLHR